MPFSNAEAPLLVTIPITTSAAVRLSYQLQERMGAMAFGAHAAHRRSRRGPDIAPTLAPTVVELGATFSMPLWLRKARGKLTAAEAKLRALEQKRAYARDKAVAEVRDAFSMLQAARERVELARGAAEAALKVAEGERERFGLGATTVLFVNLREQAAADAEVALIDSLADAQTAIARVLTASGESLLE